MERHQYGNTITTDLWKAWEEASDKPIAQIMNSWTTQMGFPLIEVQSRTANADGSTTLACTQRWFLADGSAADDRLWTIPLALSTSLAPGESSEPFLFRDREFALTVPKGATWAKLNGQQHVPLRVAYDAAGLKELSAAVASGRLGAEDRVGLLMDALALAKAGHAAMPCSALLQLLAATPKRRTPRSGTPSRPCWGRCTVITASGDAALLAKYEAFAAKLVLPAAAAVGWAPKAEDGHLDVLLRATMIRLQAKFCSSNPDVKAAASKLWDAYFAPSDGSGELRRRRPPRRL